MITGDYHQLTELAKRHQCSYHQTPLTVAWYGPQNTYVLRCDQGHYPHEITRQLSLTQIFKAGEELPEHIRDKVIKAMRRRAMSQENKSVNDRLWLIPKTDLATGNSLSPTEIHALISYANRYGLDPYRTHVVMMYSKPYITIDGYLYHARKERTPYTLRSRPMTKPELKDYKVGDTDHGWIATVLFTATGEEFNGTGIVTYEEMTAKSPRDNTRLRSPVVAAHPWQLAQKRAEWQAMRRAFPIGETSDEVSND